MSRAEDSRFQPAARRSESRSAVLPTSIAASTCKAHSVSTDCRDGNNPVNPAIYSARVRLVQIAFYLTTIPFGCVPNVGDLDIVVLAPEERRLAEWTADAQHRACDGLTLPFGHDPMFYPRLFSRNWFGIASDIARCKNVPCTRTKHLVAIGKEERLSARLPPKGISSGKQLQSTRWRFC